MKKENKDDKIIIRVDKGLKNITKNFCKKNNTTISKLLVSYLKNIIPNSNEYLIYINQWNNTKPLTKETLNLFTIKKYESGRKLKIGDRVLFGFFKRTDKIVFDSFHLDELNDIYDLKENPIAKNFPYLIKKND